LQAGRHRPAGINPLPTRSVRPTASPKRCPSPTRAVVAGWPRPAVKPSSRDLGLGPAGPCCRSRATPAAAWRPGRVRSRRPWRSPLGVQRLDRLVHRRPVGGRPGRGLGRRSWGAGL